MSSLGTGILLLAATGILMLVLMSRFFSDSLSTGMFMILVVIGVLSLSILMKPN